MIARATARRAPAPSQPKIPRLVDDPAVVSAVTRKKEIAAELERHEQALRAAVEPITARSLQEQALEVLRRQMVPDPPNVAALRHRVLVGRAAVKLADDQVYEAERIARRRIQEETVAPAYREILNRMAIAVAQLAELATEEEAFRRAAAAHGVFGLRAMGLPEFSLANGQSRVNRWLNDLEKHYGVSIDVERAGPGIRALWPSDPEQGRSPGQRMWGFREASGPTETALVRPVVARRGVKPQP